MIWADFADPRADFPPQNLCNSLGFSWSGQVVRGQWARRGISAISKKFTGIMGKAIKSQIFVILGGNQYFNRNRASGPFRIVDIPKELLVFSLLGRRRSGKPLNFNKYRKFDEISWNLMYFSKITQKTPKNWFWEVRGRKWAPGPLKYLWITAVFTRQRKGAISCKF